MSNSWEFRYEFLCSYLFTHSLKCKFFLPFFIKLLMIYPCMYKEYQVLVMQMGWEFDYRLCVKAFWGTIFMDLIHFDAGHNAWFDSCGKRLTHKWINILLSWWYEEKLSSIIPKSVQKSITIFVLNCQFCTKLGLFLLKFMLKFCWKGLIKYGDIQNLSFNALLPTPQGVKDQIIEQPYGSFKNKGYHITSLNVSFHLT